MKNHNSTIINIMQKIRLKIIILLFLIFGLISCSNKENNRVIINGKIEGAKSEKIEFTTPINGKWFYGNKRTISIDSMGEFKIELVIEKPSFVTLYVKEKASGVLLIEPRKTYDVKFDLNKKEKKFSVNSQDSTIHNFYNTLPTPDFYLIGLNQFYNDSIPSEVAFKINALREKEILELDLLLEQGKISKQSYKLASLDRNIYYKSLEAGAAAIILRKLLYEKKVDKIEELKSFWDRKISVERLNQVDHNRSPWFYTLVYNFIWYNLFSSEKPEAKEMKTMFDTASRLRFNIDEAKKYLTGETLEYYLASFIFLESWQTQDNSKEIVKIYDDFKKEYPNNPYDDYLATSIKPIIDFHKKIENTQINDKIHVVENQEDIDSFDELIKQFQGKKVFVDIWGTWCGPCKKEFKQKDTYSELLKSKDIATLYICEGKKSKEKVWKEMIKFYNLEGYHILANEELLADIFEKFDNNGSFAYPRYLLIDENGKVVNSHASYPSKVGQLEKEINKDYEW